MSILKRPAPWILTVALLALGQTAALAHMLWDRIAILRSDTVITLIAEPVDPRDLFRGDYVILTYNISRFETTRAPGAAHLATSKPWVALARTEEGWRVASVSAERPAAPGDALLRAEGVRIVPLPASDGAEPGAAERVSYALRYGLERYYVAEGEGRALEQVIGQGRVTVDVAIGADGSAGVKALRVDGEIVFEEPLF